jgi:hypothetical protein
MLQAAGDFGFEQEPRAAVRVIGEPLLDFLERHFAIQFHTLICVFVTSVALGRKFLPNDIAAGLLANASAEVCVGIGSPSPSTYAPLLRVFQNGVVK